jgi:hypothetical protein
MTAQDNYERLISLTELPSDPELALSTIAKLIDVAGDLRREEGIKHAINLCNRIKIQQLTPHIRPGAMRQDCPRA